MKNPETEATEPEWMRGPQCPHGDGPLGQCQHAVRAALTETAALRARIATLEAALARAEALAAEWEALPPSSVAYAFAARLRAVLDEPVGGGS